MQDALPLHAELMKANGKVTELEMDEANIMNCITGDKRAKPKDERVLYQNRSCILNANNVVEQYVTYEAAKHNAPKQRKDQKLDKQEKLKRKAEEKLIKEADALEKRTLQAAARLAKKEEKDSKKAEKQLAKKIKVLETVEENEMVELSGTVV
jgi:hypothetical protein